MEFWSVQKYVQNFFFIKMVDLWKVQIIMWLVWYKTFLPGSVFQLLPRGKVPCCTTLQSTTSWLLFAQPQRHDPSLASHSQTIANCSSCNTGPGWRSLQIEFWWCHQYRDYAHTPWRTDFTLIMIYHMGTCPVAYHCNESNAPWVHSLRSCLETALSACSYKAWTCPQT